MTTFTVQVNDNDAEVVLTILKKFKAKVIEAPKKLFKIDEYLLQVDKTSLPLVLTNGTMSGDKVASAQIRLRN